MFRLHANTSFISVPAPRDVPHYFDRDIRTFFLKPSPPSDTTMRELPDFAGSTTNSPQVYVKCSFILGHYYKYVFPERLWRTPVAVDGTYLIVTLIVIFCLFVFYDRYPKGFPRCQCKSCEHVRPG